MKRVKPFLYIHEVGKSFQVKEFGKITKIVFSTGLIYGNINGQNIRLTGKNIGQHTIEFDDDNVILDLTIVGTIADSTGYLIVYKEYKEKYQKSNVQDDLEGV